MSDSQNIKDKVTSAQLIVTYIGITVSPIVKFVPTFIANLNIEAAWLSPLAAAIPLAIMIYVIRSIFSKYQNQGLGVIIEDIFGKYIGKLVILLNLLWIFFMLSFFLRGSTERLVSSIYPNVNITFFIVVTLALIAYILHFNSTAIVRMGQAVFPIFILLFILITLFLLPRVRTDAILPVSIDNVLPVMKGGIGIAAEVSFIFMFFFLSDNITAKEKLGSILTHNLLIFLMMNVALLITTIGVLGYSVAARSPIPYLSAIKQISLLDVIENIEATVVTMWILSDVLLVSTFSILCLNMLKHLFKLNEIKNLVNIFIMLLAISVHGICSNRMELDLFAGKLLPYINIIWGNLTPIALLIVGKIRKKL